MPVQVTASRANITNGKAHAGLVESESAKETSRRPEAWSFIDTGRTAQIGSSDAVSICAQRSFAAPIDYDAYRKDYVYGSRRSGDLEDISLRRNLWTHFDPRRYLDLSTDEIDQQFKVIEKMFDDLPRDPYSEPAMGRYRAYARCHLIAHGDSSSQGDDNLFFVPPIQEEDGRQTMSYYQADFNPDYKDDCVRSMPALPKHITELPLLRKIVALDASLADWNRTDLHNPIHIGIHFIKCCPSDEFPEAVSSPNALHQDGEIFSFVHLVKRVNVSGGVNVISEPEWVGKLPEDVPQKFWLDEFTMSEPLEAWGLHDKHVSHHAGSVRRQDPSKPCERGVIVIDMQPMRSVYSRHDIERKFAIAESKLAA